MHKISEVLTVQSGKWHKMASDVKHEGISDFLLTQVRGTVFFGICDKAKEIRLISTRYRAGTGRGNGNVNCGVLPLQQKVKVHNIIILLTISFNIGNLF